MVSFSASSSSYSTMWSKLESDHVTGSIFVSLCANAGQNKRNMHTTVLTTFFWYFVLNELVSFLVIKRMITLETGGALQQISYTSSLEAEQIDKWTWDKTAFMWEVIWIHTCQIWFNRTCAAKRQTVTGYNCKMHIKYFYKTKSEVWPQLWYL